MKPKKENLYLILLITVLFVVNAHSQCLWRGAKTLFRNQIILMNRVQYNDFVQSYDWQTEQWTDFPEMNRSLQIGFETMIGYGLTDLIEFMLHLPVPYKYSKSGDIVNDQIGLGDILLKTRIGIKKWNNNQHGLTFVGAVRLSTGDSETIPAFGDGTTDVGIGGIFSSAWRNKWRGHLKGFFWRNGENYAHQKVGDEWKLIAKVDRRLSSGWMGFLTYVYTAQSEKRDVDRQRITATSKFRHYGCFGFIIKPLPALNVRPKLTFPLAAKGGSLYHVQPCLDIWWVFEL